MFENYSFQFLYAEAIKMDDIYIHEIFSYFSKCTKLFEKGLI